jgi:hypothetical protein
MISQEIKTYVAQQLAQSANDSQFSVVKVPFHAHTGINSPRIEYGNILNSPDYFCVATTTTGTTAVNVFGLAGAPFNAIITGVYLIARDTTAGNITIKNNTATVATIAKGTSSGVLVGAVSLANTTYYTQKPLTIVSSSAGNATVFITFTTF